MNTRSRRARFLVQFFALVLLYSLGLTPPALCQEAGKIVDQYVKAAGGGGGRGLRVASDPAELAEAVAVASAEAVRARLSSASTERVSSGEPRRRSSLM